MFNKLTLCVPLMLFSMVLAGPADRADAAAGGGPKISAFNIADLYYDYQVCAFDTVLGGDYEYGPYDTYASAKAMADLLESLNYDVEIKRISIFARYAW